MKRCVADADVYELCKYGEELAEQELANVYKKSKNMDKGIAFPLCISVNEICGHFSPLKDESMALSAGDVVKIDIGIHIDGFIAMGAHRDSTSYGILRPVPTSLKSMISTNVSSANLALLSPSAKAQST